MTLPPRPRIGPGFLARRIPAWIAGLALLGLLALLPGLLAEAGAVRQLNAGTVETTGTITARSFERLRLRNGQLRQSAEVTVAYEAGTTTRYARHEISAARYLRLAEGTPVPLRYAAADPSVTELATGDRAAALAEALWMAALCLIVALGAGGWLWVTTAAQRRAGRRGTPRRAEVTGHRAIGHPKRGLGVARWLDDAGLPGSSAPKPAATLPPVGATITVWHDAQSNRAWWDGDF